MGRPQRLPYHDYRDGTYFVTICVAKRQPLFGFIDQGQMQLTREGRIAYNHWKDIPMHFSFVTLDEFVIMPDHIHGVLRLIPTAEFAHGSPPRQFQELPPKSLCSVIHAYKASVTRSINAIRGGSRGPIWQQNYFEYVVRSRESLKCIRRYIRNNPKKWSAKYEMPSQN